MPATSVPLSSFSGSSGSERANDSSRRVSAAARVAPSIALVRWVITSRLGPFEPAAGEIDAADHHRQHVVEVVRDAAGQLADRLHLLHLPQLRFGQLALDRFGAQRLVGRLQLLRALRHRLLEDFGALGLGLGLPAGGGILAHRLDRPPARGRSRRAPTMMPSQLRTSVRRSAWAEKIWLCSMRARSDCRSLAAISSSLRMTSGPVGDLPAR